MSEIKLIKKARATSFRLIRRFSLVARKDFILKCKTKILNLQRRSFNAADILLIIYSLFYSFFSIPKYSLTADALRENPS